jgi:hypothetical protein
MSENDRRHVSGAKLYAHGRPCVVDGGGRRDRTDDLLLAKQALSQLSYAPRLRQKAPAGKPPGALLDGLPSEAPLGA